MFSLDWNGFFLLFLSINLTLMAKYLTPNIDSTLVCPVKIEYGWNLQLKHSFMICRFTTKSFIEIPPCAKMVIFVTEFVELGFSIRVAKVLTVHDDLLTQWRPIKISKFRANIFLIQTTSNYFWASEVSKNQVFKSQFFYMKNQNNQL